MVNKNTVKRSQSLTSGPLTLEYTDTYIASIKFNGIEVVRRIYFALRSENWSTIPQKITNIKIENGNDFFNISFDALNKFDNIDFEWKGNIHGSEDGKIEYSFDGIANSTFYKNRIGFCTLIPIEQYANKKCIIEKSDGSQEEGIFPENILAYQPFTDIHSITFEVAKAVQSVISFQGDVFEMEDQRNWSDDSYKVYSTPLSNSFPVKIVEGTHISQKVTIELKFNDNYIIYNEIANELKLKNTTVTIYNESLTKLPYIGLCLPYHDEVLTMDKLDLIKKCNITHLRVDLSLFEDDYKYKFINALEKSKKIDVFLEIAVFISDNFENELKSFFYLLNKYNPDILSILVFHKDEKCSNHRWMKTITKLVKNYNNKLLLGSGTNMNFAELNRGELALNDSDLICYPINPQVHASDNETLVENLMSQSYTVKTAKKITDNIPIAVTPVTLNPRFNTDLYNMAPRVKKEDNLNNTDKRQMSLFGACWTLGSIKYLSESGVKSITYYETTGGNGIMPSEEEDKAKNGALVYPMYFVFSYICEFNLGLVLKTKSSDRLKIDCFAINKAGKTRIFIINLSSETESISIKGLLLKVQMLKIDETNVTEAVNNPEEFSKHLGEPAITENGKLNLIMKPYSIMRLDY